MSSTPLNNFKSLTTLFLTLFLFQNVVLQNRGDIDVIKGTKYTIFDHFFITDKVCRRWENLKEEIEALTWRNRVQF